MLDKLDKEEFLQKKQERSAELIRIGRAIEAMTMTDGWHIFEQHIKNKIADNSKISIIRSETEEEIVKTFRLAQSRKNSYEHLLTFVSGAIAKYKKEEGEVNGK